jgi:integrase
VAQKIPATASNGDSFCSSIKPTGKTQYFSDSTTPGLRLRVTPTGAKLWVFGYKIKVAPEPIQKHGDNFKSRSMALGPFKQGRNAPSDALTVKQARDRVAELKSQVRAGEDPALNKKRETANRIAAETARKTVRDVFEEWHAEEISKRKDGGAEVRRMMEKDVLPAIGDLGIDEVRKLHISAINSSVKKRGERMAHVVFSLVRQLMGFAVEKDYLEADPSATIKKQRVGSPGKERDRILTEAEITELFSKLPGSGLRGADVLTPPIQLSTLCRIGELLSARWEHIDFERREWFLPDSKNSRSHTIHLSDFSFGYIQQLYQITGYTQWLYPNRTEDGHIDTKSFTKKIRDRQREPGEILKGRSVCNPRSLILESGNGQRWTPHDLRRTGETLMLELGVSEVVAHRCSNHVEKDKVKRTYQRYEYRREMVEAWNLLGDYLAGLEKRAVLRSQQ